VIGLLPKVLVRSEFHAGEGQRQLLGPVFRTRSSQQCGCGLPTAASHQLQGYVDHR
jgi:hypothetical protein